MFNKPIVLDPEQPVLPVTATVLSLDGNRFAIELRDDTDGLSLTREEAEALMMLIDLTLNGNDIN